MLESNGGRRMGLKSTFPPPRFISRPFSQFFALSIDKICTFVIRQTSRPAQCTVVKNNHGIVKSFDAGIAQVSRELRQILKPVL